MACSVRPVKERPGKRQDRGARLLRRQAGSATNQELTFRSPQSAGHRLHRSAARATPVDMLGSLLPRGGVERAARHDHPAAAAGGVRQRRSAGAEESGGEAPRRGQARTLAPRPRRRSSGGRPAEGVRRTTASAPCTLPVALRERGRWRFTKRSNGSRTWKPTAPHRQLPRTTMGSSSDQRRRRPCQPPDRRARAEAGARPAACGGFRSRSIAVAKTSKAVVAQPRPSRVEPQVRPAPRGPCGWPPDSVCWRRPFDVSQDEWPAPAGEADDAEGNARRRRGRRRRGEGAARFPRVWLSWGGPRRAPRAAPPRGGHVVARPP